MYTRVRMAARSLGRLYDGALSQAGLRASGFAILSAEGPLPVGALAGRLAMDRTTCTREVAPLAAEGLVEIVAGSDRRQRLLRLTRPGERKRSRAQRAWEQVQRDVVDEFGAASIPDLLVDLRRLLACGERLTAA